MHACIYVCIYECMYECMYVYMYVCMHACMYVCMYVYIYMHMYTWSIIDGSPLIQISKFTGSLCKQSVYFRNQYLKKKLKCSWNA